jgi:hypothetical protein
MKQSPSFAAAGSLVKKLLKPNKAKANVKIQNYVLDLACKTFLFKVFYYLIFLIYFNTRTGMIRIVSDILPVYSTSGPLGLTNAACMISVQDQNAFVITGGTTNS